MNDSYLMIKCESKAEIKIKGSRFIAETYVVRNPGEAQEKLGWVRKREYGATHHCYAYTVGLFDKKEYKYSDAGEPAGTAGKPIHDVLSGKGITNVLCVVTRYFGGTKLGTGGLARAYSEVTRAVMDKSSLCENFLSSEFRFTLDFASYDRWLETVHRHGATVSDSEFTDAVVMQVRIRNSLAPQLLAAFAEVTSGKGTVEKLSTDQTN